MNRTNRAANRMLIFVVGAVLALSGLVCVGVALVPGIRDLWSDGAGPLRDGVVTLLQRTPIGDTGVSWIMPSILVAIAVVMTVLVVFVVRQGRGRIHTVIDESRGARGRVAVDSAVPERALEDALASRDEFISSHASTYLVRGTPTLNVSVTCRRGISPRAAAGIVEESVRALDAVLGREIPTLIQIGGGFRARTTKPARVR